MVSPQPLPSPWPGGERGGAVPLSFLNTVDTAAAPRGLTIWPEKEQDHMPVRTPVPFRNHEPERQQKVRGFPKGDLGEPKDPPQGDLEDPESTNSGCGLWGGNRTRGAPIPPMGLSWVRGMNEMLQGAEHLSLRYCYCLSLEFELSCIPPSQLPQLAGCLCLPCPLLWSLSPWTGNSRLLQDCAPGERFMT